MVDDLGHAVDRGVPMLLEADLPTSREQLLGELTVMVAEYLRQHAATIAG